MSEFEMTFKTFQFKNLFLVQITGNQVNPIFCDLNIEEGRIKEIFPKSFEDYVNGKIEEALDENVYDAKGRVATVPFINFHEHIYSRLAKGLSIKGSLGNFHKILKNLWWKLDLILDEEMVRASALMAAMESIRTGTTYIFDHHSSPNFTKGSLKIISETLSQFGLRGTICFETTDRNGIELTKLAAQENYDFIENQSENFKGMFGLHASFTLKDQTLKFVSSLLKDFDTGIHIHLCEDKIDREISEKKFKASPLERLLKFNLLNSKSILAHGIHLKKKEYQKIAEVGAALAFNPDSNMNNSVGLPRYKKIPSDLIIIFGTDGMHSNIAKTFKQLFLLYRHSGESMSDAFQWIQKIYFDQLKFIKNYFEDFTNLNPEDRADFVIWDYVPVNNLTAENFWGHFIYALLERSPISVVQNGKFLMKDFHLQFNEDEINREIAKQGIRLKEKFESEI
jgi:cytosine/adenosine deaminase-related metal-dependent hydrolase